MIAPAGSANYLATKILEPLSRYYLRDRVEEVAVNREGEVWVKLKRDEWRAEPAPEITYDYIRKVCRVLANINQAGFDEQKKPIVSCQLPGLPFRFQAIIGSNVSYELGENRGVGIAIRSLTADNSITWGSYGLTPEAKLAGSLAVFRQFGVDGDHLEKIQKIIDSHLTVIVSGATSTGKAQPVDEPVLTPEGWRRIGDLKIGDLVVTPDGGTAPVTGVYPQGVKPVSRIRFSDGREAVSCDDHLWKVWSWGRGAGPDGRGNAWQWRVRDLKSIKRSVGRNSRHTRRIAVPLVAPNAVPMPPANLPLHPYALGVILGEGNIPTGCGSLRITTADADLLERFLSVLPGYEAHPVAGAPYDHHIVQSRRANPSPLGVALRELGLWGSRACDKAIPEIYMIASAEQRLEMLRGLLDTDGTIDTRGSVSFTTCSKTLSRQVQRLAWSLGAVASVTEKKTSYVRDGERRAGQPAFTVNISHPDRGSLFALQRKADRARNASRDVRLRIDLIEDAGTAECVCIAVGHPDHLYITRDFVVTHNTTFTNRLITLIGERERVITVEDTRELSVPHPNRLHLRVERNSATNLVDYNAIVNVLMRMTPDWIVCGELSVENAAPIYALMGKGHPVMTTVHSGTPDEAIRAFVNNISMSGSNLDPVSTAENLRAQIGCIIQLDRRDGQRKVVDIVFPMKELADAEARARAADGAA